MRISLKNVRLAFPSLWEAKTFNGEGEPAYSASFLIDPNDPQMKIVDDAINAVAKEKWGAKADATLKSLRAGDKLFVHDGDLKSQYDGFAGMKYISARNKVRPLVVDRDVAPLVEADGKIYAGCYVNVSLDLWVQDNSFGKRINASLRGVQFNRDGDAFAGGGAASEDEFDNLAEGADADSLV
jgi:hypothetical protein